MSEQSQDSSESLSDQSPTDRAAAAASILADVASPADPVAENNPENDDRYTFEAPEQVMGTTKTSGRKKKGAPAREPAAPSVPAKVKKMLGDGERYRFYKVDKFGHDSLIGDYSQQQLELANNDVELFIQTYLVHEYGDGQYLVKAMNDKGALLKQGLYSVLAASGSKALASAQVGGGNMFEQGLVNSATAQLQKLQEEMREQERSDREKLEKQNQELQIQMTQKGGDNSMSSMFMMMMQQQQLAASQAAADRRRDEMRREQMELQARIAAASAPPPMPLPPPPPPVDPLAMFTQVAALFKSMAPEKDDWRERFYIEEIRTLRNQQNSGGGGIRGLMDNINDVKAMAEMLNGPQKEESTGAEIMKAFVDNFQGNLEAMERVIVAGTTKQLAAAPAPAAAQAAPEAKPDILPDGFLEIIVALDDAPDDLQRINIVLQSLQFFGNCGNPQYEALASGIFKNIADRKKKVVLLTFKRMLGECMKREMITEKAMTATLTACDTFFEDIRGAVTGETAEALASRAQEQLPSEQPQQAQDSEPVQQPAPVANPAPVQPAPVANPAPVQPAPVANPAPVQPVPAMDATPPESSEVADLAPGPE